MLDSILKTIAPPAGLPPRAVRLNQLTAVREGWLYDKLQFEFGQERDSAGDYIPLKLRKPSVRYNICRLVVEDSVSMLFGEGRFPAVASAHEVTKDAIADLIDESNLVETMTEAATVGSVGSVAVLLRILKKRVFWQVMPTVHLTPIWQVDEPDRLQSVTERYQVKGADIRDTYGLNDDQAALTYWFQRVWDDQAETWFLPQTVEDAANKKPAMVDDGRSVRHQLGFCPIVWIRNLPGGNAIDGLCTFAPGIETQIEIEYRLSQGGRALQYASDPLLMIKDPSGGDNGNLVRSAADALVVTKDGDAKMLQISDAATTAVVDFCKNLRDIALESMHGSRANPDKMASAQSGKALEWLHAGLVSLTDKLRIPYGRGLLSLLRMVVQANKTMALRIADADVPAGTLANDRLKLQWGSFFPPTLSDKQVMATTLGQLKRDGLISRESAVADVVEFEGIADVTQELARIDDDIATQDARLASQPGVQFKASAIEAQ